MKFIKILLICTLFLSCGNDRKVDTTNRSPWVFYPGKGLSGVDGDVYALASIDSILYVGGKLKYAGEARVEHLAQWDGRVWSAVGERCSGPVYHLAVDSQKNVFALSLNGIFHCLQKWNGSQWQILIDSLYGSVNKMGVDKHNNLWLAGNYRIDSLMVESAAFWNGSVWTEAEGSGLPVIGNQGQVFNVFYDEDRNEIQTGQYTDSGLVMMGSSLVLDQVSLEKLQGCVDGLGRIVLLLVLEDENGEYQSWIYRKETDGVWNQYPYSNFYEFPDFMIPDPQDTSRIWFGTGCLYEWTNDSLVRIDDCHVGRLLHPMKIGALITAGSGIYTASSARINIASLQNQVWAGLYSAGAELNTVPGFFTREKRKLFDRIPEAQRPVYLSESNASDIISDRQDGFYIAGRFYFEQQGAFHRHITHWSPDKGYQPMGGGLYEQGSGGFINGIKLALSPDGMLYAANASLEAGMKYPGLYRWNGKQWDFVRKMPHAASIGFDRYGSLYALIKTDASYRNSFCRIPLDSTDSPVQIIAHDSLFSLTGPENITVDDSLVHIHGDFVLFNDSLSIHQVAWRITPCDTCAASIKVASSDRIRVIQTGAKRVWNNDPSRIWHEAEFDLYNTSYIPVDTFTLIMKNVQGLTIRSYSERLSSPWYHLDSTEYRIRQAADGFEVHVRLRDPVSAHRNLPLVVSIIRDGGEIHEPLVSNRYYVGNDDTDSVVEMK